MEMVRNRKPSGFRAILHHGFTISFLFCKLSICSLPRPAACQHVLSVDSDQHGFRLLTQSAH